MQPWPVDPQSQVGFFPEALLGLVGQTMRVESVTWGDPRDAGVVARFRGQILGDTAAAYDRLAEALRPYEMTPLFRFFGKQHEVLVLQGVLRPKPSNPWVNLVMFLLTVGSVFFAGVLYAYQGPPAWGPAAWPYLREALAGGLAFTVSLLAILLAHEFGHYLAARYHGTAVTLPYFIPFPFSYFGTMGAFIRLKAPPKNRRVLLDIGLAGPVAGMVVALPVLYLGLRLSEVAPLPAHLGPGQGLMLEGNSLLYLGMKWLVKGQLLPHPATYTTHPVLHWVRYLFTGHPLPLGGVDVLLHPVAWAGWAGLLVTALNLIPAGTLDGGHVLYSLLGDRARRAFPFILAALAALGLVWSGWWLWAFLLLWLGRTYAEPLDLITPLDPKRRWWALGGLVLLLLVFTPVPLLVVTP